MEETKAKHALTGIISCLIFGVSGLVTLATLVRFVSAWIRLGGVHADSLFVLVPGLSLVLILNLVGLALAIGGTAVILLANLPKRLITCIIAGLLNGFGLVVNLLFFIGLQFAFVGGMMFWYFVH